MKCANTALAWTWRSRMHVAVIKIQNSRIYKRMNESIEKDRRKIKGNPVKEEEEEEEMKCDQ